MKGVYYAFLDIGNSVNLVFPVIESDTVQKSFLKEIKKFFWIEKEHKLFNFKKMSREDIVLESPAKIKLLDNGDYVLEKQGGISINPKKPASGNTMLSRARHVINKKTITLATISILMAKGLMGSFGTEAKYIIASENTKQPASIEANVDTAGYRNILLNRFVNVNVSVMSSLEKSSEYLTSKFGLKENEPVIAVLGKKQKMYVYVKKHEDVKVLSVYDVSTGKKGFGDKSHSLMTPIGVMRVYVKKGNDAEIGTIFSHSASNGKVIDISTSSNYSGPAYMTTRLMRLKGLEPENRNTEFRGVNIHGTNIEGKIGIPDSHGCIRLKNEDAIKLYSQIKVNTFVHVML